MTVTEAQPQAERQTRSHAGEKLILPGTREYVDTFTSYQDNGRAVVMLAELKSYAKTISAIEHTGDVFDQAVSAHEVYFGKLKGVRLNGKFGTIATVAVKSVGCRESALSEATSYEKLQNIGIETYSPLLVVDLPRDEGAFVVTRRRNDLTSLDQDKWIVSMEPTNLHETEALAENIKTLEEVSQILAFLHLNGIFHPDGQVKNWATTPSGKVGVIDPEKLVSLPQLHPDTAEHMWKDFIKLYSSLRTDNQEPQGLYGVGLLKGLASKRIEELFDQLTITNYADALERYRVQIACEGNPEDLDVATKQIDLLLDSLGHYVDRLKSVSCL